MLSDAFYSAVSRINGQRQIARGHVNTVNLVSLLEEEFPKAEFESYWTEYRLVPRGRKHVPKDRAERTIPSMTGEQAADDLQGRYERSVGELESLVVTVYEQDDTVQFNATGKCCVEIETPEPRNRATYRLCGELGDTNNTQYEQLVSSLD